MSGQYIIVFSASKAQKPGEAGGVRPRSRAAQWSNLVTAVKKRSNLIRMADRNCVGKILLCSKYNVLYAFMEHPRAGGGTSARAA